MAADIVLASQSVSPIFYRLSIPDPGTGRLHVSIQIDHPDAGALEFAIPAWTPGFYQILKYQESIENVRAIDGVGQALPVNHTSDRGWRVQPVRQPERVTLDYDVHADDRGLGFFGSALDARQRQGYINGASAFMYVSGQISRNVRLKVTLPTDWKIATGLMRATLPDARDDVRPNKGLNMEFSASGYDELIDCPLQVGEFDETDFQSDGIPFRCILVGAPSVDKAHVAGIASKIAHCEITMFGAAPFRHYVFIYHFGGGGFFGGLEHRNSTVIHLSNPPHAGSDDAFVSVTAHELFHAWNVKAIHPFGLGPFDYTQPVRTPSLWFAEGVTDYYAYVIPYRAGLRDRAWILRELADRIDQLDNTPTRRTVSLEAAGRNAWEGESEGYDGLSYYLKGSLVGFWFDLRIRQVTNGRRTLDDVMRYLEAAYGHQDLGYPDEALVKAIGRAAGINVVAEYDSLVRNPGEISWEEVLKGASLQLRHDTEPFLGVRTAEGVPGSSQAVIESIEANSPADRMGLRTNDRIESINGTAVTRDSLGALILKLAPDSPVTVGIQRDGEDRTITGFVGTRFVHLTLVPLPTAQSNISRRLFEASVYSRSDKETLQTTGGIVSP